VFWIERDKKDEIKNILLSNSNAYPLELWLEELISQAREALHFAKKLKLDEHEKRILYAKNNLAYYLAVAQIREQEARKLVEETYDKAGEYKDYHWIDTYIWVCWRFAKNETEKKEARKIFYELYAQKDMVNERRFKEKLEEYKLFFDRQFTSPNLHQK